MITPVVSGLAFYEPYLFHLEPGISPAIPGISHQVGEENRSPPAAALPSTRRLRAAGRGHLPGDRDRFYEFPDNIYNNEY
jgi:hypothetical protein